MAAFIVPIESSVRRRTFYWFLKRSQSRETIEWNKKQPNCHCSEFNILLSIIRIPSVCSSTSYLSMNLIESWQQQNKKFSFFFPFLKEYCGSIDWLLGTLQCELCRIELDAKCRRACSVSDLMSSAPPPLPLGCDRISTIIQLEGLVEIEYRIIASSIAIEKEKKKQKKEKKTEKRKKKRKKEKKTEKRKKNRKKKKKN